MRRADPVLVEEIRRLSSQGVIVQEIAKRLGISERTVNRHRRALGLAAPHPGALRRMSNADRAEVLALFDEGLSREEVHRTTGWSRAALAHHFPDRRWERVECARHGALVRNLGRVLT